MNVISKYVMVALLIVGSAILLYSCKEEQSVESEPLENICTETSENLTIVVSENGRKSYRFKTPLLEGYALGRDPYREFRKGIDIITYQDDSMTTVNATLVANYAIYYENRKLWEAKGNVVITKYDGTTLYTQQLFWNSITKRIYSNVDTKVVTDTDTFYGEGFESNEELTDLHFRRFKSKMKVDSAMSEGSSDSDKGTETKESKKPNVATPNKSSNNKAKKTNGTGGRPAVNSYQASSKIERSKNKNNKSSAVDKSSPSAATAISQSVKKVSEQTKQMATEANGVRPMLIQAGTTNDKIATDEPIKEAEE